MIDRDQWPENWAFVACLVPVTTLAFFLVGTAWKITHGW